MEDIKLPKVSIVIPVYNGSKYMREAIDSAINQTYKNIEIIVVNDGSTDNGKTNEIALSYGKKIKYFKKENGGVSTALNLAISKMSGDYFSWLSHDDVYYPNKIEEQIAYIKANKYIGKNIILYSDYDLIDNKSRLITKCTKDHKMLAEKPEYSLLRGSINGITLLIPKKAFDKFGLFDENLRCTQDYEMWQRMSKGYTFEHMVGILARSRQHGEQVSVKNPRVITEGNKLWIDMVTSLSKQKMEKLEGSEYRYYEEMAKFLTDSPYLECKKICEKKCSEIEKGILQKVDSIKVSVIIPFYNRIKLVQESINSVLAQTHINLEILAVNDGSTDDISKLKQLIKKEKRIKLINIAKNQGAADARNVGIENATGDYIAFLDSDDLFVKDKIEVQLLKVLLYNSDVCHTSYLKRGFGKEEIINSGLLTGKVIPSIIYSCNIATPTVMIKKDFLDRNNYRYTKNLVIGEDICFWLEILKHTLLLGIDHPLTIVNVNSGSAAYNRQKQLLGIKTTLNYVINDSELSKFDYEIALLCSYYINLVNLDINENIESNHSYNEYLKVINSRSWKITKPLRMMAKVVSAIRDYGFIMTFKKIIKKLVKAK